MKNRQIICQLSGSYFLRTFLFLLPKIFDRSIYRCVLEIDHADQWLFNFTTDILATLYIQPDIDCIEKQSFV